MYLSVIQLLAWLGIPTGFTGFLFWCLKRHIDKKEKAREAKEQDRDLKESNTEKLMLLILQESRATCILAGATAKAVQRIPDAQCNGDMTAALKEAERIQKEEKDFLMENGIKHIFGD